MLAHLDGGRSSVGRAPDCDSGCRGFKPRRSPQFLKIKRSLYATFFIFELKRAELGVLLFSRDGDDHIEAACREVGVVGISFVLAEPFHAYAHFENSIFAII